MNSTSQPNELVARFLNWEQSSRDTIDFKKAYVDMAGDLIAGLVLSQIVYWHLPGRNNVTRLQISHDGEQWIAKKREEWWNEVRVTPKQLDRALKVLEKRGLIVTALYHFNSKPTKHVRINWDGFMPLFDEFSISPKVKIENPILPKGQIAISPKVKILLTESTSIDYSIPPIPASTIHNGSAMPPVAIAPSVSELNASASKENATPTEPDQKEPPPKVAKKGSPCIRCDDERELDERGLCPSCQQAVAEAVKAEVTAFAEQKKPSTEPVPAFVAPAVPVDAKQTPSSPDLKPAPKPRQPRPRDPIFDAVAMGSFGLTNVEGGIRGRINRLIKEIKDCTPEEQRATLGGDLSAMYEWRKKIYPSLSAPTQGLTICKYLAEWRAARGLVPVAASEAQWMPGLL